MNRNRGSSWTAQALLVVKALAQFTSWQAHQINTTICTWEQPRAALIRDVIYLDGGDIKWLPGLDSGANADIVAPGNYQGLILTYNLNTSFSAGSNTTGNLLQHKLSKALGGIGNTNGASPNYYDGGMLANDAQFFLYGGAPFKNDQQYKLPDQGDYLSFQAYQYGPNKPQFQPGFHDLELPSGVSRYVAYGAAANAPSENKAYYFSGLTSPSHGSIVLNGNASVTAANVSNTLITVDMTTQNYQKWSNKTLPSSVRGRSNAEAVWVPVGGQGILVVLGGVTYPDWASVARKSFNTSASAHLDPTFMSVIDIYDIENDAWYKQPTNTGNGGAAPSARARGCAVVAPASDFSSFNIYYYGGYDGIHPSDPYFDEVWVLSLPSFTWTRVNAGAASHGRAGHKCFSPYPDQMMIIGGSTPLSGDGITCLENGPVVMFNLTSGMWMDSYDPTKYSDYGVPETVRAVIGGSASGGATATKPLPSGWADDKLGSVFAKAYDKSKVTKYWPYTPASSTARPTMTSSPSSTTTASGGDADGLPKWARPVLGVATALVVGTFIAVFYFLWRRRQSLKRRSNAEYSGPRMISWIRRKSSPDKGRLSVASVVSPMSPMTRADEVERQTPLSLVPVPESVDERHEMPDTQLVELDASNTRSELQDTGLTRPEIFQRYSHWLQGGQKQSPNPSEMSFSLSGLPLSSNPSLQRGLGDGTPRVDSPPLGGAFPVPGHGRPPPVPEVDEGETRQSHARDVSLPTIELHYDRGVENVSPIDHRASMVMSPPLPAQDDDVVEEDYRTSSRRTPSPVGDSQTSKTSSTQDLRRVTFNVRDRNGSDHFSNGEGRST